MSIGKFIGVVTKIIDNHNFVFHTNNDFKSQLQQVVGLNIYDNFFILANIIDIDIVYFLRDKEDYFTSLSVDNKLHELSSGLRKTKTAAKLIASYVGVYEFDKQKNRFFESKYSIDKYTPSIFQEVFFFDFISIEAIYGLNSLCNQKVSLGKFLYPFYSDNIIPPDASFDINSFNSHTLISGVTGSGKSRLTSLIINQMAFNDGHITIIDPHNEYIELVETKNIKVSYFSKNSDNYKERKDIIKYGLNFNFTILSPQVVVKLLPELSEQQIGYIYEVFEMLYTEQNNIKKVTEFIINDFNNEFIAEGLNTKVKIKVNDSYIEKDKITLADEYAKKDYKNNVTYFNRYAYCFNKEIKENRVGRLHVIYAVLKKILKIYESNYFPELHPVIPSWLDIENRQSINILNLNYDSNSNIRRFINTIIQCFFSKQSQKRTLVIDEAHLLLNEKLNEKSDTSVLLSRLLRESRKFNLTIFFITQNETDVPDEIKSQFQNRFRFKEEGVQELKNLDIQSCICTINRGKISFPLRVNDVG